MGPPSERPAPPDYRALFHAAPAPHLVLTPELRIAALNDAYLQTTAAAREDLISHQVFDACPQNPDDPESRAVENLHASLRRVLERRLQDATPLQRYDIRVPGGGGTSFVPRYWSPINTPVFNGRGELTHLLHRVVDVTAFVDDSAWATQLEAEVAAQALEIRPPTAACRRQSDSSSVSANSASSPCSRFRTTCARRCPRPRWERRYWSQGAGSGRRQAHQCAGARQPRAGRPHAARPARCRPRQCRRRAQAVHRRMRPARHCGIGDRRPEHGARGPVPPAVRRSTHRTLGLPCAEARHREPVRNAIRRGRPERPVTARLRALPEHAVIEVHNEGEPIPLQDQAAIFTAHFRGIGHGHEGRSGWGLGLTVVRGLVDAHRGSIDLESTPGGGTTLRVRLPLDAGAAGSDR